MASVLASSEVDRGFGRRSGKTKDYKIGICCFSTKHTVLRNKSKDWLARNKDNVSEWATCLATDCRLHHKLICCRHDIAEKLLSWR